MNRLHRVLSFIQSPIRGLTDLSATYDYIKTKKQQILKKRDKSLEAIKI